MNERATPFPGDPYSPQRPTALVLIGTGTAGAYHAGVLRALAEAGVKIDVVAGRGVGVIGALFAAVDGAARLWDDRGFWRAPGVATFYPWQTALRLAAVALAAAVGIVVVPIAAMALGFVVFPIDFLLKTVGLSPAGGLAERYVSLAQRAFAADGLPTWLPRLALLVLGLAATVAAVAAWLHDDGRRRRGPWLWRILPGPISPAAAAAQCWASLWDLLRGAAPLKQPSTTELGRRYTELLADNIGQPGFRELVIAVHDVDARRDLVFALVSEPRRRNLFRRQTTEEADARRAEVIDLCGVGRDHLTDAVAASLTVPIATDFHAMRFAPESYWRGETHRLCDRPGAVTRLVEELGALDVEQVVVVSAAPESPGPHALEPPRLDGRGRVGEYLRSAEAAALRDLQRAPIGPRLFTIRPVHNPFGPFDFAGAYDDRSDRRLRLAELMSRGYEDAYLQFIEPVVGASGERLAAAARGLK
jgi:hypothetical protein